MNLIIVESPTKAKTITGMLDKNFKVESSFGHIRDLPKSKLGVDIENDFAPQYIIPKKSQKHANYLKKLGQSAEKIILATDEDREGEAIAWHLAYILKSESKAKQNPKSKILNSKQIPNSKKTSNLKPQTSNPIMERIVFHEITKKAIENALKNPRDIDINLVNAQQARRVLDRLVGYKLSPFLWQKVMSKLSAGRVQSAALRLVVDKEREIQAFISQKYFTIHALLKKTSSQKSGIENSEFLSLLSAINKKNIPKPGILEKTAIDEILSDLKNAVWNIVSVSVKTKIKEPSPPFTTSSLQQTAWNFYKFSAKKTMITAQHLYEGIEIQGKGRAGLITYMRTDSLNVSEDALSAAHDFILNNFGKDYSLTKPRRFKTKIKGAQEAHEAIRPTDPYLEPKKIKNDLSPDEYKLYLLIWQRFLASQIRSAEFEEIAVDILAESKKSYSFESKGLSLKFDGFLKVYPLKTEDIILPPLKKEDAIEPINIYNEEHETKPPARYNEASLVKALEKFGIGRPSTYAPTISTIQDRGYVIKNAGKALVPTEIGIKVTDLLKEHFSDIVDINFTAKIEEDFDEIASGKKKWQPIIREFYEPFNKNLEMKYKEVEANKPKPRETNELCEKCGKKMVIKTGRFGEFMACSGFPECKSVKSMPKASLGKCEKCGEGDIVQKNTKKGKRIFFGCSRYPACDFASWEKPKSQNN